MNGSQSGADLERARTYAAERAAFVGTLAEVPVGLPALCDVAAAVAAHRWWQANATFRTVRVCRARADARRSSATGDVVRIAPGSATLRTLVHELAHVAGPVTELHGPIFRGLYVELAGLVCGPQAAGALRAAFTRADLRVGAVAGCEPVGFAAHLVGEAAQTPVTVVDVAARRMHRSLVDPFAELRVGGAIAL